ncbi:glycosyltransferase family 2 protein [Neotabrizicola shimadae]|uniref:Glycosyltransferase family 2 protein n=1 Tax=Neotabrizicola shimadae TaxID=2807096 RepID=A0A8G0ZV82_9RHOB|nr:glycosyltransferase family 2 protein [Neotabrizicola shimadae]QYZ70040.1 glycosyltransferase family 2 protein [Neotabrizicola shimadae]
MPFRSECRFIAPGVLRGYVEMVDEPTRHWHVGLFVDNELQGTCLSDLPLTLTEEGNGASAFEFNLVTERLADAEELCVKVLNTGHVIARFAPSDLLSWREGANAGPVGFVRHAQGLVISGVIENAVTELPAYEIVALEGDRVVGRTRLFRWQHVGAGDSAVGRAAAFDLFLEPDLADGRVHLLHVETSTGLSLSGSPLEIIVWPNRLREELLTKAAGGLREARRRRADLMLDRLLGSSMPVSAYASAYPELGRPVLPGAPDGSIGSDGAWRRVGTTGWVICHHHIVQPLPEFGARLEAALETASERPRLIGGDLAVRLPDEQIHPLLFPAFDLERLMEQGHSTLCFAVPAEAVEGTAALSLAELMLGWLAAEGQPLRRTAILHVPHPAGLLSEDDLVASCAARGEALAAALRGCTMLPAGTTVAAVEPPGPRAPRFPSIRLGRPVRERSVSIVVPTRNRGEMLNNAVKGLIESNPGFELDIVVVDNGSTEPGTLAVLDALEQSGVRILEFGEGFNYALINNLAVEHVRHEQICFMNNDVAFPEPGVLVELCSRLAAPDVGAAGPLMTRASDIVQHGGVVLGPWHGAVHAFEDRMLGDPGYGEMLRVAGETSAVTGAFLLTRRSLFEKLGGFDELAFPVNFNDVDYCLRLWEAGHRVVFSPHVRIYHFESVSRGREAATPAALRMQRELACLRARWREALLDDPQYHPMWGVDCLPYRALSMTHRAPAARHAGARPSASLPGWL